MNIESGIHHFDGVVALMSETFKKCQADHLREAADVWNKYGSVKGKAILKRMNRMRQAKRDREFKEYTTKPCGCFCDPGGHP